VKISSAKMPNQPFEILPNGKKCTVIFYDNVIQNSMVDGMTGNSILSWDYEKYELETNYSASLSAQIESNYAIWLQKAKNAEANAESEKIRNYRDELLNKCDLQHCNPEKWTAMSDSEKLAWATYKQSLRDITAQEGFPYTMNWPVKPADTTNTLSDALTAAYNDKKHIAYTQAAQLAIQAYIAQKEGTV
jgi:HD-GYP domain-containing protein (c-di-GMP phosphodiesterase class II)